MRVVQLLVSHPDRDRSPGDYSTSRQFLVLVLEFLRFSLFRNDSDIVRGCSHALLRGCYFLS